MDDLTPMEPEFRELPPENPQAPDGYYGTGVKPQGRKLHIGLLVLLCVLLAGNLLVAFLSLGVDRSGGSTTAQERDELLLQSMGGLPTSDEDEKNTMTISDDLSLLEIYEVCAPGSAVVTAQTDRSIYCAVGVVLTEDGYVLTDTAMATVGGKLTVTLYDGSTFDATYVGVDSGGTMAVLKINATDLSTATVDEEIMLRTEEILSDMRSPAQISLELTVSDVPEEMRLYWGLPEGVFVTQIDSDGVAYRAGLRTGDVLLRIGRFEINTSGDYLEALGRYDSDDTVRVYLFRDGEVYYTDISFEAEETESH